MNKKIYLRTFGCQMNSRDSEHVIAQFKRAGYALAKTAKEADVVLFNTCSVRQHAEDKVWSELGRLKQFKVESLKFKGFDQKDNIKHKTLNRVPIIGVIGCMAENHKDKIIERAPFVDLVVGPNDLAGIVEKVNIAQDYRKSLVAVASPERDKSFYQKLYQPDKKHSYVIIMEGCNNFCSYCVVPYVRGRERSRDYGDIFDEVKKLGNQGIKSVTLLGQNVNSYNGGCDFPELLQKVSEVKKIQEVSFVTSHPKDANQKLFETMRDVAKIKKYLHLPIQSGSDRILKLMNRGYSAAHYLSLIRKYRDIVGNNAKLATDMIVGFPSETVEDFQASYDILEKVKFNFAYIFKYSPRPNTKAAEIEDDVPLNKKKQRHKILLDLQKEISKNA